MHLRALPLAVLLSLATLATAQSTYTPLPNGNVADTGPGRVQWVQQHPSSSGTPASCRVNWAGSGPLSQKCADDLFNQAEAARRAGNCISAMTDYDNAKQAAQNSGQIVMMSLKEGDGRTYCSNKLNPPKPDPNAHYGTPGVMPIGRYTCYTAPAVIANGGAYGTTAVSLGAWEGYMWIFDAHRYAGADIRDVGNYTMQGNTMVAQSGPYKRNATRLTFAQHGSYGRPTIYLSFLDNGKPSASLGCTHDGPPVK